MNFNSNIQDMTVGDLQQVVMQVMSQIGPGMDMGPMGGFGTGFAPSAGRMQEMQFQLMQTQALMRELSTLDSRAGRMATMTSELLHGEGHAPSEAMLQTWGTFLNRPEVAGLTGGSIFDFGLGVQNMMRGGMRLDGVNIFDNTQLGRQMTSEVVREMQDYFFTEGGGARLERTQGFDRTELGQMASFMGQRGAFAGLELGAAGPDGVQLNPRAIRAMGDIVSDGAEMFRELRDLFGDRDIHELVQLAEQISRENLGAPGAPAELTNRLRAARRQARAFGVPEVTGLELQVQTADLFEQLGFGGRTAGRFGESVTEFAMGAAQSQSAIQHAAAEDDRHFQGLSMPEIVAREAQGIASMATDHDMGPLAVAARMLGAGAFDHDTALRDRVRRGISSGDIAGIEAATGIDLASELALRGGTQRVMDGMSPEMHRLMESGMRSELQDRLPGAADRFIGQLGMSSSNRGRDQILQDTLVTMEGETTERLITALGSGDMDAVAAALAGDAGLDDHEAERRTQFLGRMTERQRAALGSDIARLRDAASDMDVFGPTEGTRRALRLRTVAARDVTETAPAGPQDFIGQMIARLRGDTTRTDARIMESLGEDDRGEFSVEGTVTEEDIDRLKALELDVDVDVGDSRAATMHSLLARDDVVIRRHATESGERLDTFDVAKRSSFDSSKRDYDALRGIASRLALFDDANLTDDLEELGFASGILEEWNRRYWDTDDPDERDRIRQEMTDFVDGAMQEKQEELFEHARLGGESAVDAFKRGGGMDFLREQRLAARGGLAEQEAILKRLDILSSDNASDAAKRAASMHLGDVDPEETRESAKMQIEELQERLKYLDGVHKDIAQHRGGDGGQATMTVELIYDDRMIGTLRKKFSQEDDEG